MAKNSETIRKGRALKRVREGVGIPQAEVAARLGIPERTYASWEQGVVDVGRRQCADLALALGVTEPFLRAKLWPQGIAETPTIYQLVPPETPPALSEVMLARLDQIARVLATLPEEHRPAVVEAMADLVAGRLERTRHQS